ncbi:MAG: hypothetical protein CBB97_21325 [Candidatus Endolissoclinum sp. TMED37]|nr:MAG: hypothetical protein CBB97_21325 [Candidatus Endolissoclinum sp. TMED37]
MSDDFDFGFTIVSSEESEKEQEPVQATVPEEFKTEILAKLYDIESRILASDNAGMINEHRTLVEQDVAQKLRDVEDLILPLLLNLKKNPEKDMIHWPNRTAIIDKQIEKIKAVTRYYERIS